MKDYKFIDITNLPSDPSGSLGKFRTDLLKAYNFNRRSDEKMRLLKATLEKVVRTIDVGLDSLDDRDTVAIRKLQIDREIANTSTTSGFEPIVPTEKPKRAAKRTPTKRATKRTPTKRAKRTTKKAN